MDAGDKTPRVGLVVPLTGPPLSSVTDTAARPLKAGYVKTVSLETGPEHAACTPFPPLQKKTGLDFGATADEVMVALTLRYDWRRKDAPTLRAGAVVYVNPSDREAQWARHVKYMPGDEQKQCPVILVPVSAIVLAPRIQ